MTDTRWRGSMPKLDDAYRRAHPYALTEGRAWLRRSANAAVERVRSLPAGAMIWVASVASAGTISREVERPLSASDVEAIVSDIEKWHDIVLADFLAHGSDDWESGVFVREFQVKIDKVCSFCSETNAEYQRRQRLRQEAIRRLRDPDEGGE